MAYFSKETYERKREYAYRTSRNCIEKLAIATGRSEEELEIVATLSHCRHEIHSEDKMHYATGLKTLFDIGTQYSTEETLIDGVNELNLIDEEIPFINEPELSDDDSSEYIFEYCGEAFPECEDEDEIRDQALVLLCNQWDKEINKWNIAVRAWFWKLNEKYGTNFPA